MSDPTPIVRPGLVPLASPSRKESSPSARLPTPVTSLIGRECKTAEIVALVRRPDVRLVTLTGPGGVGKTRLGLQVAAEVLDSFADGVYFVALAPITDPAFVPSAIAQPLGIQEVGSQPLVE